MEGKKGRRKKKRRKNQRHASGSLASCSSCSFLRRGPGGAITPPLHLSRTTCPHHHDKHTFLPTTLEQISGLLGGSREELGGGGGLRVSNLVLINKPTCAAAAAATHPTIPDISPAPLRRKKSFTRLPPTPPIHQDLCLPTPSCQQPRPRPRPSSAEKPIGEEDTAGPDVTTADQSRGALVGGLAEGAGRKGGG